MPRRATALAAFLTSATLLAACSGRENDLYTYYDGEPAPSGAPQAAAAPSAQSAPPGTAAPTTTTTTTTAAPRPATELLLTATGLADEPVTAATDAREPAVDDCLSLDDPTAASALWRYSSGASLWHYAVRGPRADAGDLVLRCAEEGTPLTVPGGDGWCYTDGATGCVAVVAAEDAYTVVVVEAANTTRSRDAVLRVAPLAAAALEAD